jgi:Flp pilus assembly pilin Flp
MRNAAHKLSSAAADEAGQTMAEYGVLITGIAIVVALAIPTLGGAIGNLYRTVAGAFGG